jgi:hypothetical protein
MYTAEIQLSVQVFDGVESMKGWGQFNGKAVLVEAFWGSIVGWTLGEGVFVVDS